MLDKIINKYNLDLSEKETLLRIINPIINHLEFKRRMTNEFMHHSDITLGEHIIEDSIITYVLSNKYLNKHKDNNYRLDLAIKIAMLHDLYTIPWQNNEEAKVHHFFFFLGFRNPVEAVITSITWYPEIFKNSFEAGIIIDGILHHMFPLPVRRIDHKIELKNINNYNKLPDNYKEMIINSLNRKRIGRLSFSRSKYKEGRIMSKADRIVSRHQIKDFSSLKALFTGTNKRLNKKHK